MLQQRKPLLLQEEWRNGAFLPTNRPSTNPFDAGVSWNGQRLELTLDKALKRWPSSWCDDALIGCSNGTR